MFVLDRLFSMNWGGAGYPSYAGKLTIEGTNDGEGAAGGDGGGTGADPGAGAGAADDTRSSAEKALDFWNSGEESKVVEGGQSGEKQSDPNAVADGKGQGTDGEHADPAKQGTEQPAIPDEQLQADPRYKEVAQFRDEVQPVFDKYGIPDAKEADLQLADAKVLYDIMQGQGTPSKLLDVMAQNAGWTKDQVKGVATDLIGWLTKNGFLKDGQAPAAEGQARGGDGKFVDPLEQRVNQLETEKQKADREATQRADHERKTKVFDSYSKKVGELCTAKGIDKGDVDFFVREVRANIPAAQFNAVISRIEKGNFVDVQKIFDQLYQRETERLKRWSNRQATDATRRERSAARTPAGGSSPQPAGQQKRDLRSRDERLAAAQAEWDK